MRVRTRGTAVAAAASAAALALLGVGPAVAQPGGSASSAVKTVVYTETNAAAGNGIQAFTGGKLGRLTTGGRYAAGGLGTGTGIHSQGSVVLAHDNTVLLAVDAGSNQISYFGVGPRGNLVLKDVVPSRGTEPISIAVHDNRVVVLNAGGTPNLAGFTLGAARLFPDARLGARLSAGASSPEQVGFSPNGQWVVVTEKGSSTIDVYRVRGGRLVGPVTAPSNAPGPYGFAFTAAGQLLVSDVGPGTGGSAVSSYLINRHGHLVATQPPVGNGQTAACWLVVRGDRAFVANASSSTISAYRISRGGNASLLQNVRIGGGPLDEAVAGKTLYVLVPSAGQVEQLRIGRRYIEYRPHPHRGGGLPASVGGLAAMVAGA